MLRVQNYGLVDYFWSILITLVNSISLSACEIFISVVYFESELIKWQREHDDEASYNLFWPKLLLDACKFPEDVPCFGFMLITRVSQ